MGVFSQAHSHACQHPAHRDDGSNTAMHVPGMPTHREIKVLVVGNGGVGKTSMIRRFCKGIFTDEYKKTIGKACNGLALLSLGAQGVLCCVPLIYLDCISTCCRRGLSGESTVCRCSTGRSTLHAMGYRCVQHGRNIIHVAWPRRVCAALPASPCMSERWWHAFACLQALRRA